MKKVYIQVSTHWDREWYNPFQAFRYDLIRTTDKILDEVTTKETIDNFVFDGQSIVTEDYLEIMPQNYGKLEAAVQDKSIKLGPWYVMPDEILVSGESLIRNFLQGKQTCERFGAQPFRYGYVNDVFGHIAQFPQLLKKFGIDMAYLGRGLGDPKYDFRHFVWQSPDGSSCLGYKYNYCMAYRLYLSFLSSGEKTEEEKDEYVKTYIMNEMEKCRNGVLLLNVTDDHAYLSDTMLDFIRRVKKIEEIEVVETGFDSAYEDVALQKELLPVVEGELITTSKDGDMRVVTDSISSYYPLKKENDSCQAVLENEISPMVAYSHMVEEPIRNEFVQAAYRELMKNHPHDNICGCSTDQVHKDMHYRYDQVKQMSMAIKRDFWCKTKRCEEGQGENYLLEIFNPAPYEREQIVTVELEFQQDFATKRGLNTSHQPRNMFRIYNNENCEQDYQILSIEREQLEDKYNITQYKRRIDKYVVSFAAKLEAFGMTEYLVVPAKAIVRHQNTMKSGDSWVENAYARVDIAQDGTFTLFDKITGKSYEKLHYFIDDSDAGNGWFHEEAANQNPAVSSKFGNCSVEKVRAGSLVTTFRITKIMYVPENLNYETYSRSEKRVELKIISELSLKQDSGKVYIETKIENCAKDHRLKLLLPTHVSGETYQASQAFYFAERKVGANLETLQWQEPDPEEKHFSGIIYKTDQNGNGLAFVGQDGFHQAGVLDDEEGTISVVMFRSFGRVYLANNPIESQIQGELKFQYTIVPMNRETDRCWLLDCKKYDFRKETVHFTRGKEDLVLKEQMGMLKMSGQNVALSIIKVSEHNGESTVLRVFNTEKEPATMQLTFPSAVKQITSTDLYENDIEVLGENVSEISVVLNPYEIKTFAIRGIGGRADV